MVEIVAFSKTQDCNLLVILYIQVCCSALWVAHSEVETESAAECDTMLTFSSEITSLTEGNGDIHSRSLSPWNWTPNTDRNRIPRTLWEAECSTSFCSSPIPGQKDQHNLNSVPIYQDILVLTSHNGRRCYKASFRSVAVGCTCVRAETDQK
uniref:Interleukin 17a/f2 n=1 Tax=Haplochromis burtoni TaxID=8153 RepID=A0A3Q2X5R2_HAPBU